MADKDFISQLADVISKRMKGKKKNQAKPGADRDVDVFAKGGGLADKLRRRRKALETAFD